MNCIYKIFSKAYTERLKKLIDKLTSKSQKAYSSTKVISEAILNILEYTKNAEIEGKNLALLAIDFKKAFDSVSHDYLLEILKFYNISPYMIAIFKTMIKNKQAGILTDSGITELFLILCGVAQGDSPSKLLFLVEPEPLLWKLCHSFSIQKVMFDNGNKLSDSSFADDVTILLKGTADNIAKAKLILDDFKKLSGLEINA